MLGSNRLVGVGDVDEELLTLYCRPGLELHEEIPSPVFYKNAFSTLSRAGLAGQALSHSEMSNARELVLTLA